MQNHMFVSLLCQAGLDEKNVVLKAHHTKTILKMFISKPHYALLNPDDLRFLKYFWSLYLKQCTV